MKQNSIEGDILPALKQAIFQKGPYFDTMHHPLTHARELFEKGLFPPALTDPSYTGNFQTSDFLNPRTVREVAMEATPDEVLALLLGNPAVKATNRLSDRINNKIQSAETALLTGCNTHESAHLLVERLHSLGFRGTLDIWDISPVPLTLIEVYADLLRYEEKYGIKVKTTQKSIAEAPIDGMKCDMVISDVLGTYLTFDPNSRELSDFQNLIASAACCLKEGGLFFVRDMAEGSIPSESRTVGNEKQLLTVTPDDCRFKQWLREKFEIDFSIDEIVMRRTHQFPDPNHPSRRLDLFELWRSQIEFYGLKMIFASTVVPKGVKWQDRYFQLFVIENPQPGESFPLILDSISN